MAGEAHLKLVVSGGYSITQLSEEIWANSYSFRMWDSPGDPVGTLPALGAEAVSVSSTESLGQLTSNFAVTTGGPLGNRSIADWLGQQVGPAIEDLYGASIWMGQSAQVKAATVYLIGADGKGVRINDNVCKAEYRFTPQISGGKTGSLLPLQNALVASLDSARGGRSGRGRVFLPGLTEAIYFGSGAPVVNNTDQVLIAEGVATFLNSCSVDDDLSNTYISPIVTSATNPITYGKINQVRVGRVIDTQRRRRGALPENYHTANL